MKNKSILFLTKDAFNRTYLPTYGNMMWKTPNIDELALKGSVFTNHHTGAPSTIMSNMCMFTKLNSYESGLSDYTFSKKRHVGETLWTRAESEGYECHIIWDHAWDTVFRARERYYCYGENTIIHSIEGIRQGVGAHYVHPDFLVQDLSKFEKVKDILEKEIIQILKQTNKPVFLWMHIPHVINGFTGYGSDIEAFDQIVGIGRHYFSDDFIFISADHGNMNGEKGKLCYGFDVYEPNARIPLITPLINNTPKIELLTSNVDITTIIFDRIVPHRDFIFCDSAFYAQPKRKLAILYGHYKYIYNKQTQSEELYDLEYDPNENCNLISDYVYDSDRNTTVPLRELYFYPNWEQIEEVRTLLKQKKDEVWKSLNKKQSFLFNIFFYLRKNRITNVLLTPFKFIVRRKS